MEEKGRGNRVKREKGRGNREEENMEEATGDNGRKSKRDQGKRVSGEEREEKHIKDA